MKIVRIVAISRSFDGIPALADFNLEIEAKERVVILGPSGCGKTTILRLIAGFDAPDTGEIFLSDELVAQAGRVIKGPEQRNLGLVFQDLALWPHLSVKGNLDFGLRAKGLGREERTRRIGAILELVGMSEFQDRKPSALSGGQQQRTALARSLVLEPQVLLMDEPLSSLDTELNVRLRGEILRLQKNLGFTLVHVTHDRQEAFDLATKIVIMAKGRMVFTGDVGEARAYLQQSDM